ncbi:MAG: flagellar biosynthetic protein FliO [Pseudomonadota bacterium]
MDISDIIRVFFGLIAVIGMIGVGAVIFRKAGLMKTLSARQASRRLELIESLAIDNRRRIVLLRCDNREHLVMLGAQSESVIANNIMSPKALSSGSIHPLQELRNACNAAKSDADSQNAA